MSEVRAISRERRLRFKSKTHSIPEDPTRVIYLVPELCHMTGLTEEMTSDHKVRLSVLSRYILEAILLKLLIFQTMKQVHEVTKPTPQERHVLTQKFIRSVNGEAPITT